MSSHSEEADETLPFVVTHVSLQDGAWSIWAYATMREALTAARRPGCATPVVFGSWADYFEWKRLRISNPPPVFA